MTIASAPSACSDLRAVARAVAFAGRAAVPSVVSASHCSFSGWLAGAPFLVSARDFRGPAFASQIVHSFAAEKSCWLQRCPYSAH